MAGSLVSGLPAVVHALPAAAGEPNPLLPAPAELILGAIAFAVLYFVLKKFAFPQIEANYQARVTAIEGGLAEAERKQAEADAALAQYQAQLADARNEASRIREEARAQGAQIVAEARTQAQAEADRVAAAAQAQIAVAQSRAAMQLQQQVGALAVTLAGRIVGESLQDDARTRATVDRFIADLEATAAEAEATRVARAPAGGGA